MQKSMVALVLVMVALLCGAVAWAQDEAPKFDPAPMLAAAKDVLAADTFGYTVEDAEGPILKASCDKLPPLGVSVDENVMTVTTCLPLKEGAAAGDVLAAANEANRTTDMARFYVDSDGALMADFGLAHAGELDAAALMLQTARFLADIVKASQGPLAEVVAGG